MSFVKRFVEKPIFSPRLKLQQVIKKLNSLRKQPTFGDANQISHATRPIRSTTQIWVKTRHQYGIPALVSQTSFGGESSGSVAKCRLFPQARN